jgi:CheY-like chemotaxis protein
LTAKPCILVVDDEPLNRELLVRLLGREYELEEAESVDAALAVVGRRGGQVGLIICDQMMPGRFGTELAAEVHAGWPHIRVVLLTGYDDDEQVRAAQTRGLVAGIIAKPWKGVDLRALIRDLLLPRGE